MGRAASDQVAADFRGGSGNGVLVADIISDLGVFGSPAGSGLLRLGFCDLLAVPIGIGGGVGAGRTFQNSGSGAV